MRSNKIAWRNKWQGRKEPVNGFAKKLLKCRSLSGKRLLDVGCGNGQDSFFFAKKGFEVTAVDFSPSGIAALQESIRKNGIKNIRPFLLDITGKLPFKKHEFDVIYAHLALHYFDDGTTREIFKKIYGFLKSGGLFMVKCKSVEDCLYGKGVKVGSDTYYCGHTRHFFSKDYLADLLSDFKDVKISKTSSQYHGKKSAFVEAIVKK